MLSIHLRPPDIENRQFPGHWEGLRPRDGFTQTTDFEYRVAVYFCDPHSPQQGDSNENMNGLVHRYLPKGTDLSGCNQQQWDAIADEINTRPRERLRVRC